MPLQIRCTDLLTLVCIRWILNHTSVPYFSTWYLVTAFMFFKILNANIHKIMSTYSVGICTIIWYNPIFKSPMNLWASLWEMLFTNVFMSVFSNSLFAHKMQRLICRLLSITTLGQYSSFAIFAQYFEKVRGTFISILWAVGDLRCRKHLYYFNLCSWIWLVGR